MTAQQLLKKIEFTKKDGTYVYVGIQKHLKDIYFNFIFGQLCCYQNGKLLFSIGDKANLGTLLVIFQEYKIVHERYIYERVDHIGETFEEQEGDEETGS